MRRMIGLVVLTAVLATLVVVPVAGAKTPRLNDKEQRVIELINEERADRGLAPLRVRSSLVKAARAHSTAMAKTPFFSHISPDGSTPGARMKAAGYTPNGYRSWRVGENIAWGCGVWATAEGTVRNWMKSAPHRKIILTAGFRDVGIGIAVGQFNNGDTVIEDASYFTLDFGRRSR